jgi:hypothetical protein
LALVGDSTMTSLPTRGPSLCLPFFLPFFPDDLRGVRAVTSGLGKPACAGVAPILYNVVPQTGHLPRVPGVPVAVYSARASIISRLVLHFTQ